MTAGLLVAGVGVVLAVVATLDLPRDWIPVMIGAALFVAGAARAAASGRRPRPPDRAFPRTEPGHPVQRER